MKPAVLLSHCLLVGIAFGCSKQEAAPPPAATAAPAAAAAIETSAPAPPSAAPLPKAPVALATADSTIGGIRAEVTELKRSSGGTLTLKFTIVNESSQRLGHSDVGLGSGGLMETAYAIDGVHLIDLIGKKKYFVAKDSAGACVCSQFGFVDGGARANHWAKFSAPPDDVERISVVIPFFAPLDDVPISR